MKVHPIIISAVLLFCAILASPLTIAAQAVNSGTDNPERFVTAMDSAFPELDPQHSIFSSEAQVFTALYEGLFIYDPATLEPVKAVCKSYTRSKDGKSYTFTIREDAAWSDGSPVLAPDFKNSWIRAITPGSEANYSTFFDIIAGAKAFRTAKGRKENVGISILSDRVLEVKLEHPAPWFTRLLCHHSFAPIHPSMMDVKEWRTAIPFPVNGPWRIQSATDSSLDLIANPHYWDASAIAIPELGFLFTDDEKEATRKYNDGEIHWLAGPVDTDTAIDDRAILVNPLFSTTYWYFSSGTRPWDDPRVRRALAFLLPWDSLRSKDIYAIPASTLVLRLEGYKNATGIEKQDKKAALELLLDAGYPQGKGLPEIVILSIAGKSSMRVTDIFKKAWESVLDIKVTVKTVSNAKYFAAAKESIANGKATLAMSSWIGDFADPLAFLQLWVSDSGLNDASYKNSEYDALIAESSLSDGEERFSLLAKAESRLLFDAAVLPLYHGITLNVIDVDWVQGWYTNPLDLHPYKFLKFGERSIRSNVVSAPRENPATLISLPLTHSRTGQGILPSPVLISAPRPDGRRH